MRRILSALIACLTLAAPALAEPAATQEASGVYPPLSFSFWSERTAGYEWICEYELEGALAEPFEETKDLPDGNAHCTFSFGVNGPGQSRLIFSYGVNYSLTVPERLAICDVEIDERGLPRIRWAERFAGDNMLCIRLPSDPSSGRAWNFAGDSAGMLTLLEEEYVPVDPYLEGAGGTTEYNLRVDRPGETVLMFDYIDVWDPAAAALETYTVFVNAGEDMEISIAVDEPQTGGDA